MMRPRTLAIFTGLVIFGLAGFVTYLITDEPLFFLAPFSAMIGMAWLNWSIQREITELKRRLADDA